MKHTILSAALVTGTSVGAGMMALPLTLSRAGLFLSLLMIGATWGVMYAASLLVAEVGLKSGCRSSPGADLEHTALFWGGPVLALIQKAALLLLTWSLLCAYLHGGSSVVCALLAQYAGMAPDPQAVMILGGGILGVALSGPLRTILRVNRLILTAFFVVLGLLTFGLLGRVQPAMLPWAPCAPLPVASWTEILPVLTTSFGFQVVVYSVLRGCSSDPLHTRQALFRGSLVAALTYTLWSIATLGTLSSQSPEALAHLASGHGDAGQFMQALALAASWAPFQGLVGAVSVLAVAKSALGVGLALRDSWRSVLKPRFQGSPRLHHGLTLGLTVLPPLGMALAKPGLFLKALGFAGMILMIITIIIPLWVLNQPKARLCPGFFPLAAHKGVQRTCLVFALGIILCEILNILG